MTPDAKKVRGITERTFAIAVLLVLAEDKPHKVSLLGFYDDDADAIDAIAERLGVPSHCKAFRNKLRKVIRHLVRYGVLHAQRTGTHKEYIGEPTQQTDYILENGRAHRMQGKNEHYHEPEWEAGFILRHAYPDPAQEK